jgi:deoxyribose-phosphate aldolase
VLRLVGPRGSCRQKRQKDEPRRRDDAKGERKSARLFFASAFAPSRLRGSQRILTDIMTAHDLAARIDHTVLKPEALPSDVHRAATEAMQHGFASVCAAPVFVSRLVTMLSGSGVRVCTVVGFPHGTSKATVKAIEATASVKDGADEIDVVCHLPHLLRGDVDAARAELMEVVRAARAVRRQTVIKAIVESALLLSVAGDGQGEALIAAACRAVRESGCDFIKTSTGFHPAGGATAETVAVLKRHAEGLGVKAAGGIRDLAAAEAMLAAGADRLGLSGTVAIVEELKKRGA